MITTVLQSEAGQHVVGFDIPPRIESEETFKAFDEQLKANLKNSKKKKRKRKEKEEVKSVSIIAFLSEICFDICFKNYTQSYL